MDQALSLPFIRVHELQDAATGRWRQLLISQTGPEGEQVGARRLLVLLDGNLSALPAALMQHTRVERGVGVLRSCTLVGIGYPGVRFYDLDRRAGDYLPPVPPGLDTSLWQGGRADLFSVFLDEQLLPWLQAQCGEAFTEIGLFGHSYGGLFTLYKLLHAPGVFNAFFSISPSLWWADGWLLRQLADAAGPGMRSRVFLGIGADERGLPGDDLQRADLHRERDLQGRFAQLVETLRSKQVPLQTEVFAGEDHGSVMYPALGRALGWLTRLPPQPQAALGGTRHA